ncbi:MAG: hypothetical protein K2X78_06220 [Burkholderiaceae bacterium]|nr:hypothetical protein [Burkholderiaceae bacterium]
MGTKRLAARKVDPVEKYMEEALKKTTTMKNAGELKAAGPANVDVFKRGIAPRAQRFSHRLKANTNRNDSHSNS